MCFVVLWCSLYLQAVQCNPNHDLSHCNLGVLLREKVTSHTRSHTHVAHDVFLL